MISFENLVHSMSNVNISVRVWRAIMQGEMRFSLVQFLTTLVKFCIFPFLLPNWLFGRKACTHWERCFSKVKGIFEFHGISFINNDKLKNHDFQKRTKNRGTTFIRKKTQLFSSYPVTWGRQILLASDLNF